VSALWAWLETLDAAGVHALPADEARHVAARRLRPGDPLVVFDGQGRLGRAEIETITRRSVELRVIEIEERDPPASGLVVASAIPKGERLSTMLQMSTQLGTSAWQPLVLAESVVRKLDVESARMRRILVEACKVARRSHLLEVHPPRSLEQALASEADAGPLYFGDREAHEIGIDPGPARIFIGPEAGFTEFERECLRDHGARPRALAPHNLRIEVAVVAAAAAHHAARAPSTRLPDASGKG